MPASGQLVTVCGQTYCAVSGCGELGAASIAISLNMGIAFDGAACASCFW